MDKNHALYSEDTNKYPVMLSAYNPKWVTMYEDEQKNILKIVGTMVDKVFHFGSTSIPGMIAKPTIDILIIMKPNIDMEQFAELMINAGYICTKYPDKSKQRKNCMNFILPYEINSVSQYKFYIHIREYDVPYPEVLFCKYLCEHRSIAEKYIELKQRLEMEYKYDREGYMNAKNEFIKKFTEIAIDFYN